MSRASSGYFSPQDLCERQRQDDLEQYEQDLLRAKDALREFLNNANRGMVSTFDVEEAKKNLKLFGVNL